jgi:hypothetical protein
VKDTFSSLTAKLRMVEAQIKRESRSVMKVIANTSNEDVPSLEEATCNLIFQMRS